MHQTHKRLVANLKKIRKEKGMSQKVLAESSDMIPSTYSRIESGQVSPGLSTLIRLAESLEVEVAELFQITELKDTTLVQKLDMITSLSDYNRNVLEIMMESILEKDKLEKAKTHQMQKRLEELEQVRKR